MLFIGQTDAIILLITPTAFRRFTLCIDQTVLIANDRVNVLIYLAAVGRRQSTDALRLLIDLLQTNYNGRVKVINRSNCRQTNSDGAINKSNSRRTLTRLLIDLNVLLITRHSTINKSTADKLQQTR